MTAASMAAADARAAKPAIPFAGVLLVALFAFCHPYAGLRDDASLYVMHVLADLDPGSLGRDQVVVDDGQMRFTLFPLLLRPLVATLGAAKAAMLVAALGSAAWLAGLAALAHRLAPGRIAVAMVAMVAVLPLGYGDHVGAFRFAETAATPRPLAEAAVMAGFAALLAGHLGLAGLALAVATLIHPLMAAAGLGVAGLVLWWRAPSRWRIVLPVLAATAAVAVLALALAGLPPFVRLLVRPDGEWLALMRLRSPHLFPTLWTGESFAPLLAQAGTIAVAAHRAGRPQRDLLVATLVVCGAGLAAEVVLADKLNFLVAIETQAWRAGWLVGVFGGCALAFCTATLWRDGPRGRVVLALLALAWFFQPSVWLTLAIVSVALLLELGVLIPGLRIGERHALVAGLVAAVLSLLWASGPILGYAAFLRGLPAGDAPSLLDPLRNNLLSLPLAAAIAGWLVAPAAWRGQRWVSLLAAAGCVALLAADVLTWDQRSAAQAYLESPRAPPGLATVAAGRKPEVFWVGDLSDAWFALERPQYFSPQQGVGAVFSRPLAIEWTRRAELLAGLGLVQKNVLTPWRPAADGDRERVTQAAVDAFCARPDAPGLVLFPRDGDRPRLRDMIVWPLPAPLFSARQFASTFERTRIESFGIVPCAPATLPR